MLLGRGALGGESRLRRHRPELVLLVALLAVMGTLGVALLAPSAASAAPASATAPFAPAAAPVAATPSANTPAQPFIDEFTASPSTLYPGYVTTLSVLAFPENFGDILSYDYYGLPGCASENTSQLVCTAEWSGNWSVEVAVTDTNPYYFGTSYDSLELTVLTGSPLPGQGQFFNVNSSVITNLNDSDAACTSTSQPPFYQEYCYPEAQDPTLLNLPGGQVGLVTQMYTNLTTNTCGNAPRLTVARVGFAVSTTGGSTFGPAVGLGNTTCHYLDAIEPAFTAVGSDIYGAFIEEDSTTFAANYVNRTGDAIGFIESTNSGATWSSVKTIATGLEYAKPAIAASGSTVYVAFDRLVNSTHTIAGGVDPISVNLLYSLNSGSTFTGPLNAPGLNATADYNAMSPALTVSASGTVALAYATDRSCLSAGRAGTCNEYADEVVVVTSTTHGTIWLGPFVAGRHAGETACYSGACLPGFFESTPQIAISYAPTGDHLYVTYAAVYSQGASVGLSTMSPTGVFASESSNGGTTWTTATIAAPDSTTLVRSFDPGLAVGANGAGVTYLQMNATGGIVGFANSLSQWWDSTPLGGSMDWTPANAISITSFTAIGGAVNATRTSYAGDSSAVAFNVTTGSPLVAFPIPVVSSQTISHGLGYYYVNTSYPTDLAVGLGLTNGGPGTVSVLFYESGLPSGAFWNFTLNGISYTTDQVGIAFSDLPAGQTVIDGATYQATFWEIVQTEYNASPQVYYANNSVDFAFNVMAGLEYFQFPGGLGPWITTFYGDEEVDVEILSTPVPFYSYAYWDQQDYFNFNNFTYTAESEIYYDSSLPPPVGYYDVQCIGYQCSYPSPWYFPLGSVIELTFQEVAYNQLPPVYWTGQGNGNYTGPMQGFCEYSYFCPISSGPITINGPINETAWLGDLPVNLNSNVTVSATGVPASSHFGFSLDNAPYSSPSTTPVTVYGVGAGAHTISDVTATSTRAGYKYFGAPNGPDPFVTPVETNVQLNFTSLVDLNSPAGRVTFHAPSLSPGTTWSLVFNGTSYSSATPWINITTRNGTYEWAPGDAVNPGGSTGYTPSTSAGNLTVATGRTYTVNYLSANELEVLAATGGTVSINGGAPSNLGSYWSSAGTQVSLQAVATPGYVLTGWSGTGDGSYNGTSASPELTLNGPVVETASFAPLPGARFNLTFVASGLPTGTWWSVDVGGYEYSSNSSYITASNLWPWSAGTSGAYPLAVPVTYGSGTSLVRYVPLPHPGVVGTNGTFTPAVPIDFATQVQVSVSGSAGGSVELTYLGSPEGTSDWIPQGANITVTAIPAPGSTFQGWVGTGSGSYTGFLANVEVNATGPVQEVATFVAAAPPTELRYGLTFALSAPLPAGTEWSITFGGQGYSTTGASLTVPDVATGTYSMQVNTATAPDGLTQFVATANDPVAYTVTANATISVAFADYYWVSVSATVGGSTSPTPGWYAADSVLYLVATSNATYSFAGWSGTGNGSYSGTNGTVAVLVTNPLTEVASFHATSASTAAASVWQDPSTWVGIGAAGLIVGIVAGVLVGRLWVRPAARPQRPAPPASGATGRGGGQP